MPIYEYRCADCGYQKEYLQRMSDAPLTDCPECGKRSFNKLVSAAGFQLKGGGWYATDFKNSGSRGRKDSDKPSAGDKSSADPSASDTKSSETKAEAGCGTGACPACS
ncbi:MAG TPA: zinc ribbon domain-containing protein [Burkholderiales bacterium]|jgi:putative FmdB family regulatory protein|nr:zinc ribbon domain-containing protein [Burkholderiales bacterium]